MGDISYKTRVQMSRELLMQLRGSAQTNTKSAAYWVMKVGGLPECCHQGLAKKGIKTAKAIIRPDGGEDICGVNFHNNELLAVEEWCRLGMTDGHDLGDETCPC